MIDDLVARLKKRAHKIPQEVADRENECARCRGAYGTETWEDYSYDCDRLLMLEAVTRITEARAQVAELREMLKWAYETLFEINVDNYNHDDVCRLNDASVEVILGIAPTLAKFDALLEDK